MTNETTGQPGSDRPDRPPLTRPSTAFERPPGNVYVIPADTELDPDGPAKFHADRVRASAPSSDHPPIESTVSLADDTDADQP